MKLHGDTPFAVLQFVFKGVAGPKVQAALAIRGFAIHSFDYSY